MIQRIQTVYLFGVVVLCALIFVFPFGEITAGSSVYVFNATGVHLHAENSTTKLMSMVLVTIISIAALAIALISILFFKKRLTQIMLCQFNILLLAGLIVAVFYYFDEGQSMLASFNKDVTVSYDYDVAIFLPMISIILTFLASRAIKKDEKLIRSVDRIR
ncbi:MAG: DUF4293 domain-containing protein [Bacteroidota bacterium]